MSRNGSRYLREKREQKQNSRKKDPVIQFVRSFNFYAKLAVGIIFFGYFIYSFSENGNHPILLTIAAVSIPLYPFAKKGADDTIRHLTSEKVVETLNAGGPRGLGALYLVCFIVPLTIPFGLCYFIYHYLKYRSTTRSL